MTKKNKLLSRLSRAVLEQLEPDLKPVTLEQSTVLHKPGEDIAHLYFPLTCMISITTVMIDGGTVEVGAVGSREVVGINAFMGGRETTQTEYIVQLPGEALKIQAEPLRHLFESNIEFRSLMLIYTQALIAQISQNVACNRLHGNENRCARWLLEVRDRVQSDTFPLTHEFIAQMLGANRTTVTHSLALLKDEGIIDYSRGIIRIMEVEQLEAASCECYDLLQSEFDRLLGPLPVPAE